ncbi:MAG: type II toxin-antitoxin system prevent-host-death family antitoxin [Bryobacteraceae bacterium]
MEVNIYEAKTKLSQLIERAMMGEEVVIAKAGKPMVRLVRVDSPKKRKLGTAAGMIRYTPGWDDPLTDAELEKMLDG